MNKERFAEEIKQLGIIPTEEQLIKLEKYCDFLLQYNEHTNLTAIKIEKEVYLKHFYDSLTIVKCINFDNEKIIDVGTGAGFPGIVLKIFFPNIDLTLIDSNNKKTKFLEQVTKYLGIENIKIINKRIEDYVKENRNRFDIVTARAVSHLRILLELCLPLLNKNGKFLALKGDACKEILESCETLEVLNAKIIRKEEFFLPIENSKRTILVISCVDPISDIYPRSYDKIIKKPLKKNIK